MQRMWKRRPRRRNEPDGFSVLDIGTSSVRALIARQDGDKVVVLGRGERTRSGAPSWSLAADGRLENADALSAVCDDVLCQAEDATEQTAGHKIVPDIGYVVVPAVWIRGASGTGSSNRVALETTIQAEEFIDPVVQGGRRALRNLGRETGAGQWALVDATLVAFGIDGHRVTDPVGFRGYRLEATVFVVAAQQRFVQSLRSVANALQLEPPRLVPEPMALAASLPGNGLAVQIGAHTTGLCLAKYGAPLAVGSVSVGGQAWTRALADVFRFTLPRAEALKLAYSTGRLSVEVTEAVEKALAYSVQSWLGAVMNTLRSWGSGYSWTPEIYLCGRASGQPDVFRAVSSARWLDQVPFPHTPHVQRWDGSSAPGVMDRTGDRRDPGDAVLLSAAAWAARERGYQTPDGVLRASLGIE